MLNYFKRNITNERKFIPEIDGIRFIAIFSVVLFHIQEHVLSKHMSGVTLNNYDIFVEKLLKHGHYGVQLFFCFKWFFIGTTFCEISS